MVCPSCGRDIPDAAQFCPYCGCQLKHEAQVRDEAPITGDATTLAVPGVDSDKQVHRRRIAIIVAEVALAVTLIVLLGSSLFGRVFAAFGPTTHPVTFRAVIDGLDENSSRIPAHLTGTDAKGNKVDMQFYLARDGVDCELDAGTYHLEVLGSPIASDGTIYDVEIGSIDFDVPKDLGRGKAYVVPSTQSLMFTTKDPATVTDEEIEEAVEWARKDDDPSVDADALEQAARNRRDNPPLELDTETLPMF